MPYLDNYYEDVALAAENNYDKRSDTNNKNEVRPTGLLNRYLLQQDKKNKRWMKRGAKVGKPLEGLLGDASFDAKFSKFTPTAGRYGTMPNTKPVWVEDSHIMDAAKQMAVAIKDNPNFVAKLAAVGSTQGVAKVLGSIAENVYNVLPGDDDSTIGNSVSEYMLKALTPMTPTNAALSSGRLGAFAVKDMTAEEKRVYYNNQAESIRLHNEETSLARKALAPEYTSDTTWTDWLDVASNFIGIGIEKTLVKGTYDAVKASARAAKAVQKAAALHPKTAGVLLGAGTIAAYNANNPDTAEASILGNIKISAEAIARAQRPAQRAFDFNIRDKTIDNAAYAILHERFPEIIPPPVEELSRQHLPDEVLKNVKRDGSPSKIMTDSGKQNLKVFHQMLGLDVGNVPHPTFKVDNTVKGGVDRVKESYASADGYNTIITKYGLSPHDFKPKKVSRELMERLRSVWRKDNGEAWTFNPATGEKETINNEHIYSIGAEAKRQEFELRAIDANPNLTDAEKAVQIKALYRQHKSEMVDFLDPEKNILLLTERANQKLVKSAPASNKSNILSEGINGLPGEGGSVMQDTIDEATGMGTTRELTATKELYLEKVNAMQERHPHLTDESYIEKMDWYNEYVKPLRTKEQGLKGDELTAAELRTKVEEEVWFKKYFV